MNCCMIVFPCWCSILKLSIKVCQCCQYFISDFLHFAFDWCCFYFGWDCWVVAAIVNFSYVRNISGIHLTFRVSFFLWILRGWLRWLCWWRCQIGSDGAVGRWIWIYLFSFILIWELDFPGQPCSVRAIEGYVWIP